MRCYGIINSMDDKHPARGQGNRADHSEKDRAIQLLSLEYQTIRDEMIMRMSSRFQFLGFTTTAAALLATIVGHSLPRSETWLIVGLAVGIFIFGLTCFLFLGRQNIRLSARVATIEQRINELSPVQAGEPSLLSWVSEHQQRGSIKRISHGQLL